MKKHRILLVALITLPVSWIIEALIHAYIFQDGPLVAQIISPQQHELWMRSLLVLTIFIIICLVDALYKAREEENKLLEKSVMEVEERERRRIGHDLHDGLGQLLTGLAFKVRGLGLKLEKGSLPLVEDAAEISVLIDEAKEQVSSLSKGLSPVALDEEGLISSFKLLASYTQKMFGIPCALKCEGTIVLNDETAATQLYRITQEAVTNAVKHAKPDAIEISLRREGGNIIISIKDDGIGIPEKTVRKGSMGLKIMRYRANIINASLNIKRDINGGTLVTCTFPHKSN